VAKAFPSAEGFGTGSNGGEENIGGRGGDTHFVTTLSTSGAGSLRSAFEFVPSLITVDGVNYFCKYSHTSTPATRPPTNPPDQQGANWESKWEVNEDQTAGASGSDWVNDYDYTGCARMVVPRIGGFVELGGSKVTILYPYMTYAGQVAPGDGIMVKDSEIELDTHDVILRHLKSFPGTDEYPENVGGLSETYGLILFGDSGNYKYNITIDHCSFGFANDETFTVYANKWTDVTWQWCTISDPNEPGSGFGSLVGSGTTKAIDTIHDISMHHNAWISCQSRSPQIEIDHVNPYFTRPYSLRCDFRNNVVYMWRGNNNSSFARQFGSDGGNGLSHWNAFVAADFEGEGAKATLTQANFVKNWSFGGKRSNQPPYGTNTDSFHFNENCKVYCGENMGPATTVFLENDGQDWTVTVDGSNNVTVDFQSAHGLTTDYYLYTNDEWDDNTFMNGLYDLQIASTTTNTITFSLAGQGSQTETTESTAAADFRAMKPASGFSGNEPRLHTKLYEGHSPSPSTLPYDSYTTTDYEAAEAFTAPAITETDVTALFGTVCGPTGAGAYLPVEDSLLARIKSDAINDNGDLPFWRVIEDYPSTLAIGDNLNTNTGGDWTVTVSSNVVTVTTSSDHGMTSAHATGGATASCIVTNGSWTVNSFMDDLSYVEILSVPSNTTFTFALVQGDQGATTETGTSANFWTALYSSQPDGIPDSWKDTHNIDPDTDYTGVLATSGYSHVDNWFNDVAGDTIDAGDYPLGTEPPVVTLAAEYNGTISVAFGVTPTVADPDIDALTVCIDVTGSLTATASGPATIKGGT
jgi:hypothetical protein